MLNNTTLLIIKKQIMSRPVTLFTGQWADLPFENCCKKAKSFGLTVLEIACGVITLK